MGCGANGEIGIVWGGLGPSQRYLTASFCDQVYGEPIANGDVGVAALTNVYGYTFITLVLPELRASALSGRAVGSEISSPPLLSASSSLCDGEAVVIHYNRAPAID